MVSLFFKEKFHTFQIFTSRVKSFLLLRGSKRGWYYSNELMSVLHCDKNNSLIKLWNSIYQPLDGYYHPKLVHHMSLSRYLLMAFLSIPLVVLLFFLVIIQRRAINSLGKLLHFHIGQISLSCWDFFTICLRLPEFIIHLHKRNGSLQGLKGPIPWCLLDEKTQRRFIGRTAFGVDVVSIYAAEYFFFPSDGFYIKAKTVYDQKRINKTKEMVRRREHGLYEEVDACLYHALNDYPIDGKKIAVIGSAEQGYGPWYETIALEFNAKPFVIEYNVPIYESSVYQTVHISELSHSGRYDGVISISSFEHTGLGRYGDPIFPDGDLEAMENWLTLLSPQGILYLEVPIGKDAIIFHNHRIYGKYRLPQLFRGWDILAVYGLQRSMFVRSMAPVRKEGAVFVLTPGSNKELLDFDDIIANFIRE